MYKMVFNVWVFVFLIVFTNHQGYTQVPSCVGGIATAASSTLCSGSSTTISVSVPIGSIQWQESVDGNNWANVSGGTSTTNYTPASVETTTFSYTGAQQIFIVPTGVTSITADGYGAAGGHGASDFNGRGALGGRLKASLSTTPAETLFIYVGEKGHNTGVNPGTGQQADNLWIAGDALGGYNGGGNAGGGGGGGGGATDIRQGGNTLLQRIFVAAAGGGGGNQRRNSEPGGDGGNGGGMIGASGVNGAGGGTGGEGGSQSTGGLASGGYGATSGSLGQGGYGASLSVNNSRSGGGGGGGYYGGGGGGSADDRAGGGGGGASSYSTGTIISDTQGYSSATDNGSLALTYTVPSVITATYTTPNLIATTYYRAVVTDGSCVENSSMALVTVHALPTPTFISQPLTAIAVNSNATYTTESSQANYTWSFLGFLDTDYSIISGGTAVDNTVTLKWLTKGNKIVTINYSNSNNCSAVVAPSSVPTNVVYPIITRNGVITTIYSNGVNKYGAIGTGTAVSTQGEVNVKNP